MHSYFPFLSRSLKNSTAVALITVCSFSAFAMNDEGEGAVSLKRCAPPSSFKPVKFSLNTSAEADAVERDELGKPWRVFVRDPSTVHQLESNRFSVQPDDIIQIHYNIIVREGGKMALGLWNTSKDGWYGEEVSFRAQIDMFAGDIPHIGILERKVPVGETETSLILRNDLSRKPRRHHFYN